MKLDKSYQTVGEAHFLAQVADHVRKYTHAHPERAVLRLGLNEGTRPLPPAVTSAIQLAVSELGTPATFKGYSPSEGYLFLRRAIVEYYKEMGIVLDVDDVFVSGGGKEDLFALSSLFAAENTVLLQDPGYPTFEELNLLAGRPIVYLPATEENGFLPGPPEDISADLIFLCSPNNPTGVAYDRAGLTAWVEYALEHNAVILFDAAYEGFVAKADIPRSIYEIPGASNCAIEICSFSKTAGFSSLRCGYTIVPASLVREGESLRDLWERLLSTRTGGVAYPIQAGAAAVLSPEGVRQTKENIRYYQRNAARIGALLTELSISFVGGVHAPYLWVKCPDGMDAWELFDVLLSEANVVCTPGVGFGKQGANYFRLSAWNSRENTARALARLQPVLASLYGKTER